MPFPFSIKISINYKLAILGSLGIVFFITLGLWQWSRADQKKALLAEFSAREMSAPLSATELTHAEDPRFYRASLTGHYDAAHTLLLDNKIVEGRIGYEVYTPFKAKGMKSAILIDRGFVPAHPDRRILPHLHKTPKHAAVMGMINLPPTFAALGNITESAIPSWPLRVEYLKIDEIEKIIGYPLLPYVLMLAPESPEAHQVKWQIIAMPPERHQAYAVQWFALALTLLILCLALSISIKSSSIKQ